MAVANGQIPASLLVPLGGERLRAGTASRWAQVCAQVARRYGWTPTIVPGGGYRDIISQQAIFRARYTAQATGSGPYGDVRFWAGVRYVRTSPLGPAAVPGTSNHGLGKAIDVADLGTVGDFSSPRRAQFASVALSLGLSDAEGRAAGEPWHWVDTYDPDAIAVSSIVTTGGTVPTNIPATLSAAPPVPQETDMIVIRQTSTGKTFTAAPGLLKHHSDADQARVALALCRQTATLDLSDADIRRAVWDLGIDNGADPITRLAALPAGGTLRA